MDILRQDLRLALRLLWKDRAFALTTILTLSLCIGANSAIFTVVRSVLLRPLPYPESDRLVFMFDAFPGAGVERAGTSVPNYIDRRTLTDVLESVALYQFGGFRVGEGTGAEGVTSLRVTPSFFTVLRTRAARGRLFTEQEGTVGHERVAVLSYAFAQRQPGGLDGIVGRELRLDTTKYTVVGVLPAEFTFLDPDVRVWVPLAFTDEQRADDRRYSQNHQAIGRLAEGATLRQAQERLHAMNAEYIERAGSLKHLLVNAGYRTVVAPFGADLVRTIRGALQMLWGGVLFVLLIAAVNITNLSLTRASGRLRELATRHALGAPRARIVRQLVTETTVLMIVGGVCGLAVGYWSLGTLPSLGLAEIPRAHEIQMDAVVVVFTLSLALVLGVVIGAVPAMHIAGMNPSSVLRDDNRAGTAGRRAKYVRRGLVVAEVALAFVLLIGAGLLLASFRQLLRIDPGFVAAQVLTGRVAPLAARYPDNAALRSYTDRALERIRALPGVAAAGVSSYLPFGRDGSSSVIIPEGRVMTPGESLVSPNQLYVTPGYLEALRVPLVRGRLFTDGDAPPAPPVVIIDEQLADRFWPNADPIGRRMYLPRSPEEVAKPTPDTTWMRVVGVVKSVKLRGLVEGEDARVGAYYLPYASDPTRNIGFAIRTGGTDPATVTNAVNGALTSIDPEMQLFDTFAMSERIERSLNPRRAPMLLSLGFGVVALLLASIGLYGVLAYQVGQRTREIGIRMALGSDTGQILSLILREGIVLVLVGLALGIAGATALRGFIASQLYGVGPLDSRVVLLVTSVLAIASLVACIGPARRAARVDPVIALQS
ncbi:MAG TPA: ABC transporter permease [Vicinamibacterales bacterium]|nr:ABC transporter permease [Vicinamibacterales bacterium]